MPRGVWHKGASFFGGPVIRGHYRALSTNAGTNTVIRTTIKNAA
jgi:hypothetical protein